MPVWLILEIDLTFNDKLKPITNAYRADLQPEDTAMYYGMHFISAPPMINPGDHLRLEMVLRAYPKDPCPPFQIGKKVFLKEGRLTRAEGVVTRRREHISSANSVFDLSKELPIQL